MDSPAPSFLLVDGNNVIHSQPELLALHLRRKESARDQLIRSLETCQDFGDARIVVVFDGRGSRVSEERRDGGVQVFYSSADSSADWVIERLAAENAQRYRITVATNDVAQQDAVIAAGGEAISVEALMGRIAASEREKARWVSRGRP